MIDAKIKTLLPVVIEIECPECGHTDRVAANGWTAIVCRGCKAELEHPHPELFDEEFVLNLLLHEMCADDQIQLLTQQRNQLAALLASLYKDNPSDLVAMLDKVNSVSEPSECSTCDNMGARNGGLLCPECDA